MSAAAPLTLDSNQARLFVLYLQGLWGNKRFEGSRGIVEYVEQAGCIQFDPLDICGRNADLVLFARIKGYKKSMLQTLLYRQRTLADHWDKNMSIILAGDWHRLYRSRENVAAWHRRRTGLEDAEKEARLLLNKKSFICARDFSNHGSQNGFWGTTGTIAGQALERMFFEGELGVHHKQGNIRYFAPATALFGAGEAPQPVQSEEEYYAWHTLRRIAAVGLMWNRASGAWLGIPSYTAARREAAFALLLQQGLIKPCRVEGVDSTLYICTAHLPFLQSLQSTQGSPSRIEFLPPLDGLLWDRELVRQLFGFCYTWEAYTPAAKRTYGHYILPV